MYFLVGAYQETLGDLHNLFGDTNVVSVKIDRSGHYDLVTELGGDSVEDVLTYVEYDVAKMRSNIEEIAKVAVEEGYINTSEQDEIISAFDVGLKGYTYYER